MLILYSCEHYQHVRTITSTEVEVVGLFVLHEEQINHIGVAGWQVLWWCMTLLIASVSENTEMQRK